MLWWNEREYISISISFLSGRNYIYFFFRKSLHSCHGDVIFSWFISMEWIFWEYSLRCTYSLFYIYLCLLSYFFSSLCVLARVNVQAECLITRKRKQTDARCHFRWRTASRTSVKTFVCSDHPVSFSMKMTFDEICFITKTITDRIPFSNSEKIFCF